MEIFTGHAAVYPRRFKMAKENREIKSSVFVDLFADDEKDGEKNYIRFQAQSFTFSITVIRNLSENLE